MQAGIGAALAARVIASPAVEPLRVDIFSRHLQWLRTADEVAEDMRTS